METVHLEVQSQAVVAIADVTTTSDVLVGGDRPSSSVAWKSLGEVQLWMDDAAHASLDTSTLPQSAQLLPPETTKNSDSACASASASVSSINNRTIRGHRDQLPRSVKRMLVEYSDNDDDDNSHHRCDNHDAAMTKSRKHYYLFRHAPQGKPNTNLLILLHGAGDTHIPYDKLAQRMELPQTATLAISARNYHPLVYNLGHHCEYYYTWFDRQEENDDDSPLLRSTSSTIPAMKTTVAGDVEPWDALSGNKPQRQHRQEGLTLQTAAQKLTKVLHQLIVTEEWIIPERVFLFGYGDGATLAMQVCECWGQGSPTAFVTQPDKHHRSTAEQQLQSVSPLGGAICVAGGSSSTTTKENDSKQQPQQHPAFVQRPIKTPILLVVGEHDESFPPEQAQKIKQCYGTASVDIYIAPNKGQGMIQSQAEMYKVMEFLSQRLVRLSTSMMVQPPSVTTTSERHNQK